MLTQHLAKKFERAFLTNVWQGGWEISFCLRFFARLRFLARKMAFTSSQPCSVMWAQTITYWAIVFGKNFRKGVQPYFEILLSSFIHKIFEQNFYQYVKMDLSSFYRSRVFLSGNTHGIFFNVNATKRKKDKTHAVK